MTAVLSLPVRRAPVPGLEEKFAGLLSPEFLLEVGWDAGRLVLSSPIEHPQIGRLPCVVTGCEAPSTDKERLCATCFKRHAKSGLPLEEFVVLPRAGRKVGVEKCAVPGCPRPWKTSKDPVCSTHSHQRRKIYRLPLEEFVHHPDVVPLPSFGPCEVVACIRDSCGKEPYCLQHRVRVRKARRVEGFDEDLWRRTETSIPEASTISFRGLPPLVVNQLLFGIQQRTKAGAKTKLDLLRLVCDGLRAAQVASVLDHDIPWANVNQQKLLEHFAKHVRRALLSPETEVLKDVWDMWVFGHSGTLDFRSISQQWLRAAARRWAADDIPHRRGRGVRSTVQSKIKHLERLSESLRAHRADGGGHPAVLGRADIEHHLHRLTFLNSQGELSDYSRTKTCRELKWLLQQMRALGLAHAGEPMAGLPEKFSLTSRDVPDEPEDDEAGRDLPTEVMRFLCSHLNRIDETSPTVRVGIELVIDTGRRPDEICQLAWDCLAQDPGGKHVLIYDNSKSNREQRRLPIPDQTAALITQQKQLVRERFPNAELSRLKLLPSPKSNPYGHKAISAQWLGEVHRDWVDALPEVMVTATVLIDGKSVSKVTEFDKTRIFAYAYRHTYAQRHADAGVAIDVLCELMDHEQMETTRGYYRVGHGRRRDAVDKVASMQFDRHGNRVWREAEQLLDSERLRNGLGEVAVPYGRCSEPTNVQAGGGQCPIRFRCPGCDHFSTDVSYLPDLEGYLADLLRNRERIASMAAADEWAKVEAMPSQEEITRIRRLIRKVKEDLDTLTDDERVQIQEASTLVRRTRQVMLGMPRVRQPLPDIRPERPA
jgi:integrase